MAPKLFEYANIGKLSMKNRLIMPPMLMGYGSAEGYVTERMKDYFEERAKGGVGMVIVEAVGIRFEGKVFPYFINCYDKTHLPGLTELANVIKKHGARAAIQIADGGRNTRPELTGEQPVAPSPIATHKRNQPRVLTVADIKDFVKRFATSTGLAKQAGFEGVEIHAAHVYFLNQFLSGASNIRTDEYGGSVEKRTRILVEIIEEARKLVGDDYPIWVRINAEEPGETAGITIVEAKEISQICERAGYDAISVSSGGNHYEATIGSMYFPEGYLVPFTEQIKQVVKIPVIAVGRISAQLAEKVVQERKADFVAIGRGLMVDPELPIKAQEGRYSDIAPCTACMNCVHRGVLRDAPITCAVNAALGREREFKLTSAESKQKVVVIGAGPAGLEAARVAAIRGHSVTLIDDGKEFGGQLRLMGVAPHKDPILAWIDYMAGQLAKLGVVVKLETKATTQAIEQLNPDVVVVATGLRTPSGRGQKSGRVNRRIVHVQDVLAGKAKVGANVAILGDDAMAAESADLLSEAGKNVTIIAPGRKIAPAMLNLIRNVLIKRLSDKKVVQKTEAQLGAITAAGVEVISKDGRKQDISADTVILGNDFSVDTGLLSSISGSVQRTYVIGGSRSLLDQEDAVADGFRAGRSI